MHDTFLTLKKHDRENADIWGVFIVVLGLRWWPERSQMMEMALLDCQKVAKWQMDFCIFVFLDLGLAQHLIINASFSLGDRPRKCKLSLESIFLTSSAIKSPPERENESDR